MHIRLPRGELKLLDIADHCQRRYHFALAFLRTKPSHYEDRTAKEELGENYFEKFPVIRETPTVKHAPIAQRRALWATSGR